ncbi:MAG: ThiF family adenylyltransferase [Candidatus Methylomirabilales bacterium]
MDTARIGVVGDDDLLASLYVLSASALGVNNIVVIAPRLDGKLRDMALKINPALNLVHVEGYYTHPVLDDVFIGCDVIVDVCHYALANKLLLEKGFREGIPIVRGFCYEKDGEQGVKIFTYMTGREWQDLEEILSPANLPGDHFDDGALDIIAAGFVLDETKNILMGRKVSEEVIQYERKTLKSAKFDPGVFVIGAGALGNFVGLALGYSGFRRITFMDPDVVEVTNLNRQVFLYDAIGLTKAETLTQRLNDFFGIKAQGRVAPFARNTDISRYDVIFECTDSFEARIVVSEKSKEAGKALISGGTSADAGQAVVYHPEAGGRTPAELLGLYDVVAERQVDSDAVVGAACVDRPDPSVVMANQMIAGFMVDLYRRLLDGQETSNIFYDSKGTKRV